MNMATLDFWSGIVGEVVPETGDSGKRGFDVQSDPLLEQEQFDYYTHSDFFRGSHIESHWLPFLKWPPRTFVSIHGRALSDDQFQPVLQECLQIDRNCYGTVPHIEEVRIASTLARDWAAIEPDIYTFMLDHTIAPTAEDCRLYQRHAAQGRTYLNRSS